MVIHILQSLFRYFLDWAVFSSFYYIFKLCSDWPTEYNVVYFVLACFIHPLILPYFLGRFKNFFADVSVIYLQKQRETNVHLIKCKISEKNKKNWLRLKWRAWAQKTAAEQAQHGCMAAWYSEGIASAHLCLGVCKFQGIILYVMTKGKK